MKFIFSIWLLSLSMVSGQMILSYSGTTIDSDAANFFSRTSSLTSTETNAVNNLVINLKKAGIWDEYDIIYPFVGSSAAKHAENLKSDNYDITWGASVIHDANGVGAPDTDTGDADRGIISGYNAASYAGTYVLGSAQVYITVLGTASTTMGYFGTSYNSSTDYLLLGRFNIGANDTAMFASGSAGIQVNQAAAKGFFAITSDSNTDHSFTKNGTEIGTSVTDNAGADETSTRAWYILQQYNAQPTFNGRLGFMGLAPRMTQSQISAANTIVTHFQTSLGRN